MNRLFTLLWYELGTKILKPRWRSAPTPSGVCCAALREHPEQAPQFLWAIVPWVGRVRTTREVYRATGALPPLGLSSLPVKGHAVLSNTMVHYDTLLYFTRQGRGA